MTKTKILGFLIIILSLFLAAPRVMDAQFPITTECQQPLTTFSNGSDTFNIKFPPGGGTTCDTIADCPTISLPASATVFSVKVDMHLSDPASEIGTPFIWIPNSDSDTLAQMRTSNGTIVRLFTAGDIAVYSTTCGGTAIGTANFDNPSRITVMPGGDVWVANRSNNTVTRLSPKEGVVAGGTCGDGVCNVGENNGNCPQECEEYEVNCNYGVDGGPRGATYDINGNIWIGGTGDTNMYKFNLDGSLAWGPKSFGIKTYGMIGDAYDYVWIADNQDGQHRACRIDINTEIRNCTDISRPYGIGIDNEGDIWFGNCSGGGVIATQVGGTNSGVIGSNTTPGGLPGYPASGGTCGVAVDQNNVVWVTHCGVSPGEVWAIRQNGTQLPGSPFGTGNLTRGIAVDFDGNIWVVNRSGGAPGGNPVLDPSGCGGSGSVTKLAPDGSYIATYKTCGVNPYCYSDMTGLRTIPKSLKISGSSTGTPLSSTGTFEVCTDGTVTCTSGLPCAAITAMLGGCSPNAAGDCEIPLKIFSITAGDYTLSNLEVIYGKKVPVTIGGLVPCGRNWDDSRTPWNEKAPCNFCFLLMMVNNIMNFLLMLAAGIAVLALIITGLLFVTSSGDSERKSQSKTALKYSIWGFIVIFISWIIVDFLLIGWGYLDPLGGEWNIADCDVSQTFCGDNIRQTPNDYGFYEECDGTDNPCAEACSPACTCAFIPSPPPPPPPPSTFCGDGTIQTPNDAGTGGPANDGFEECDTDGSSCGSLVCEADCTCKTDPTPGVCGVWFSGIQAGNPPGAKNYFMSPFELMWPGDSTVQMADWVANGNYPNNDIAFSNAHGHTFDGIAIDKNTRLELWEGPNYTGNKVVDITGPTIINNNCWLTNSIVGEFIYVFPHVAGNCFGLDQTYWTNCIHSNAANNAACVWNGAGSMHSWGTGSCKITCTAP